MKKVTIVLGSSLLIIIGLISVFGLYMDSIFDMCGDEPLQTIQSPDGQFVGKLYVRNCGATTDYVTRVDLQGNTFLTKRSSKTVYAKEGYRNTIKISWVDDDHFLIETPYQEGIYPVPPWKGIAVEIRKVGTSVNHLSEEEEKLSESFCREVTSAREQGFYLNVVTNAWNSEWQQRSICFRKDGTDLLELAMHDGILGKQKITHYSQSYIGTIIGLTEKYNFQVNNKTSATEDLAAFGSCRESILFYSSVPNMNYSGWWIGSFCGSDEHPGGLGKTSSFWTNMEGSYVDFLNEVESLAGKK